MTELRAKAFKELEKVPEEHVAEVIDFLAKFNEKRNKEKKEKDPLTEIMEIVNRRERNFPANFDWKKEYLEWLDEKYGNIN